MPQYLLVDTNTLYNLVSETEYSPAFKRIEHLIQHEYITLLNPSVLTTEWEKHREKQKKRSPIVANYLYRRSFVEKKYPH